MAALRAVAEPQCIAGLFFPSWLLIIAPIDH
jgi:hypothetical protein